MVQNAKPLDDKYSPSHQPAWYSAKPKKLMYLKYGYSFHFTQIMEAQCTPPKKKNNLVVLTAAVHSGKQPGAGRGPEMI